MNRRTGWVGRVALLFGSSFVMLTATALVGEFAVRYRERHRSTVPGTMSMLYYPHYRLRHALTRNTDYFGWLHVNEAGFRGLPVQVAKRQGTQRIMSVGGSTTFDTFVLGRDSAAWPARLEHWLGATLPGGSVEVINAGVPGYRVLDNLMRLQLELYVYSPDVIILYHGHNDLFAALRGAAEGGAQSGQTPGEIDAVAPWTHWLRRHSLLFNKLASRFRALRFRPRGRSDGRECVGDCSTGNGAIWESRLQRGVESFERDLRSFVLIAQSLGAEVVLMQVQHVSGAGARSEPAEGVRSSWRQSVPAPVDVVLTGYAEYADVMKRVAEELDAVYISSEPFSVAGPQYYAERDPIHFNADGADRMGRGAADALIERGIVRAGATDAESMDAGR